MTDNKNTDTEVTDAQGTEKHRRKRRKLLKTVTVSTGGAAIAGALPAQWSKPVLKQAVLPAHGQQTCIGNISIQLNTAGDGDPNCDLSFDSGNDNDRTCVFSGDFEINNVNISLDPTPGELGLASQTLSFDWGQSGNAFSGTGDFLGVGPGGGDVEIDAGGGSDEMADISIEDAPFCDNDGTLDFTIGGGSYCPISVTINFSEQECEVL